MNITNPDATANFVLILTFVLGGGCFFFSGLIVGIELGIKKFQKENLTDETKDEINYYPRSFRDRGGIK